MDQTNPVPVVNTPQNNPPATDPKQIFSQPVDNQALTLARSIALQESSKDGKTPNYNAKGKSGEKGAYQWMPGNYEASAAKYGVDPKDFSPESQDKVAYAFVKEMKDKGFQPAEIASLWNSGHPDNYENHSGTNSAGVKYDTPKYVEGVKKYYNQLYAGAEGADQSGQGGTATADASTGGTDTTDKKSLLMKLIDFAFPIVKDFGPEGENRTGLQKLGDAGLSALWFVPGLGEVAGAGIKGLGLLGEGAAEVAGHALGGAATGYGADVASHLADGKTSASDILTPGLGTVTGGVIGGAASKLGQVFDQGNVVKKFAQENNGVLGQTKRGANDLAESLAEGKDTGEFLANKGVNLKSLVNPETVAYDTAPKAQELRQSAQAVNEVLTDALKNVPGTTSVDELEQELIAKVQKGAPDKITASERAQLVKGEMEKVRSQYGDNLSASEMNELKHRAWNESGFDMTKSTEYRKGQRIIGNSLKTRIEGMASEGGLEGVGEMNQYLGSHLDAADALERLNGTKAKGGRLGDLMQKHALGMVGGGIGLFGGGPVGSLVGAMAGEYAGGKLGTILRKVGASPLRTAILNRMETEDPEIVQKMLEFARQTPHGNSAINDFMKSLGLSSTVEEAPKAATEAAKVSPQVAPKASKPSLLRKALEKTAIRVAS